MIKRTIHAVYEKLKNSGRRTKLLMFLLCTATVVLAGYGSSVLYVMQKLYKNGIIPKNSNYYSFENG